jgi:peptidoglycan-associated lipoprotein
MKKWSGLVVGGAVLAIGSAGCATKGYVKDQIGGLRADMEASDTALDVRIGEASQSTEEAMARADAAYGAAEGTREMALGKTGFREADHHRVYFAFDSAALSSESTETLAQVAQRIADNPQYLVDLYGFTDATGDENYNLGLGRRRADAVMRYLIEHTPGQLSRFQSVSFGEMVLESEGQAMSDAQQRRQVLISLVERIPVDQQDDLSQK